MARNQNTYINQNGDLRVGTRAKSGEKRLPAIIGIQWDEDQSNNQILIEKSDIKQNADYTFNPVEDLELEARHNALRKAAKLLPFAQSQARAARIQAKREQEAQRKRDMQAISAWMMKNVTTITGKRQASAIASRITRASDYDRAAPVVAHVGENKVFVPAPATL